MLVGITGYAQHGKDTTANILVRDYGFQRDAFAEGLRESLRILNPIVAMQYRGQFPSREPVRYNDLVGTMGYEQAKAEPEVRRLLQVMGTEVVRNLFGNDTWVESLFKRSGDVENLVISDVRFPNEAQAVWENGGEVWYIGRLNADGTPYDNGISTNHPSEAHIAELATKADRIMLCSNVTELEQSVKGAMEAEMFGLLDMEGAR